ncbi:DUF4019 domain-containing protein [Collimonas sp.]|uniref:DUF4019 domain-containing protein n=1 Tax=Collimonas sp. TaxID=1963772 RepID=UPI0037BE2581
MIQNGIAVLQQIDRDGSGDVWEGVASFVKAKLPKDTFVKSIRQARSTIGTAAQRRSASVVRVRYNTQTGDTPPGLYANIDYATDLRDGTTVFELVSFQLDPNGIWRVTGYIPRDKQ